jgi:hypothetical protein
MRLKTTDPIPRYPTTRVKNIRVKEMGNPTKMKINKMIRPTRPRTSVLMFIPC